MSSIKRSKEILSNKLIYWHLHHWHFVATICIVTLSVTPPASQLDESLLLDSGLYAIQTMDSSLEQTSNCSPKQYQTFQLVIQILQQNPDDLNDWEDKGAERQSPCMIPKNKKQAAFKQDAKVWRNTIFCCKEEKQASTNVKCEMYWDILHTHTHTPERSS